VRAQCSVILSAGQVTYVQTSKFVCESPVKSAWPPQVQKAASTNSDSQSARHLPIPRHTEEILQLVDLVELVDLEPPISGDYMLKYSTCSVRAAAQNFLLLIMCPSPLLLTLVMVQMPPVSRRISP
jgi:hypothetical protein